MSIMYFEIKISSLAVLLAVFCTTNGISVPIDRNLESGESLSESESYSAGYRGRHQVDARPSYQTNKRPHFREASAAASTKSNVVYGKGKVEQPQYTRYTQYQKTQKSKHPQVSKFVPSPEDTITESEGSSANSQSYRGSGYDPVLLQKYMQKYANQLYNAQKYATQLSEAQKQVLSQDVYTKKYTLPQTQKYAQQSVKVSENKFPAVASQSFKFSEPLATTFENAKFSEQTQQQQPSLQDYAEPTAASQHFAIQKYVTQHKVAKPKKVNAYLYDNAPQSTSDYKYQNLYGSSLEPQVLNQYFTTAANSQTDKEFTTGYETHQSYGNYGTGSTDRLESPKITGYKIPAAVSLSYGGVNNGGVVDEKGISDDKAYDDHHHYPHAEPKYEFMYQVQDHEKHNHFGHSEARKGKQTWGKYYVQLPDGRFETVKYWADKTGYHAQVEFKGHAKHPSHKEHGYKGYEKVDDAANSYSNFGVGQSEEYN